MRILSIEKAFNKDLMKKFIESENLDRKKHFTLRLCTTYCNEYFDSKNNQSEIPKFSKMNNLYLDQPPKEIIQLNLYERILIQTAKSFMTIVKLKPYRQIPNQDLIPALKGVAIHLPLPLKERLVHLNDTIPSTEFLKIIVDGLPTKTNKIWRSLVDVEKEIKAIEVLKKLKNPYYKDLTINYKLISNPVIDLPQNIKKKYLTSSSESDQNDKTSFLKHQTNDDYDTTIQQHFTIQKLTNDIPNETDIEKYSTNRVIANPIRDRDRHLDHKCFPHIFFRGTGGMYDLRRIQVTPSMFGRWILKQANPIARRDISISF